MLNKTDLTDDKIISEYIKFLEELVNQANKLLIDTIDENIKLKERLDESCRYKGSRENKQKK